MIKEGWWCSDPVRSNKMSLVLTRVFSRKKKIEYSQNAIVDLSPGKVVGETSDRWF